MRYLSCDFETNNSETECRVWLWGMYDIYSEEFWHGTTIEGFWESLLTLCTKQGIKISFHNLKFDGEFLLIYLFKLGYTLNKDDSWHLVDGEMSTLISDMGQWYNIRVKPKGKGKVNIIDTLKLFPFTLAEVAKSFGLEESKGEIDYSYVRPIGYVPSKEEVSYVRIDVTIAGKAWRYSLDNGDSKMTAGSNALSFYKEQITAKSFEYWFPVLSDEEDAFIRKSYRGGWTYVNKVHKGKLIGEGIVLDVNSLYPSRMYLDMMPYGKAIYFVGRYRKDEAHPLYVQRIRCGFRLNKGYLPTLQIKGNPYFVSTQYAESSKGEIIELTLTSVDLELFLNHYETWDIEYIDGYMFMGVIGMFHQYIDYWMEQKTEAEKHGEQALRTLSKLKMNSLYGKFAKRPKGRSKVPYLEGDVLKLELGEEEEQGKIYIPVGSFITAYARRYTITSAQACYDRFLYADTDSLHLIGEDMPVGIEVDKYELGKWKHESTFRRAIFIGAKCYAEDTYMNDEDWLESLRENPLRYHQYNRDFMTKLNVTCAGLPENAKDEITFDNFRVGAIYNGKLVPYHVANGIMLKETTFEIKDRDIQSLSKKVKKDKKEYKEIKQGNLKERIKKQLKSKQNSKN